jgi:serine/threonine-protein kinase
MTYTPLEPLLQHPDQPLGATFAGYTIARLLGSGAMGEVYLAKHPRLPRQDALKILRTDVSADEDYHQRFIREADLAATLWHPNIVRVNDRGEFDGQLWIAMDFVDGMDAARLLATRYPAGMPLDQVTAIVAAVADALDYAHQRGLLHRDIKPANILVANTDGDEQRILLGDFGIARSIGDISGLTATNMTIGTLPYAAPEQLMDEPIDGRADQYALAATAYHLLTGSPLFPQSNPAVVISRHLNTPPPALADTRPELAALDPVLATALAKDPADRFTRCTDFARAFAQEAQPHGQTAASVPTMQAPVASRTPSSTAMPPVQADTDRDKQRRRHRIVLGALLAVAVLTTTGVIGSMIEKNNTASKPAPPAAVLDGTYRLDFDWAKETRNGAPNPATTNPTNTDWWAFRSSCPSTGCVATATKLDNKNHQVAATPSSTADFHFRDGHWQRTSFQIQAQQPQCLGADGKIAEGADTESLTWSAEPQPDGTLRGLYSTTVLTNECGFEGTVGQTPFVATRAGDAPPSVTVADPATVTATPMTSSPIPAVAGVTPVLDGTYRLDYDRAKQTVNGQATADGPPWPPLWLAFRSLCTSAGCVATGAQLANENNQAPIGDAKVLRFVDGHWQDTPQLRAPGPCPGATNGTTTENMTRTWSWEPQHDGTLRGTDNLTVLTNECGDQGNVYRTPLSVTRTGDVPPAVVLADPTLFVAPAAPATGGHH